jgi:nucleotide-binding universal stress UspA family protein
MLDDPRILLCYDSSDEAIEAIDFAARFCAGGTRATVLYGREASPMAISADWAPVTIPPEPDQQEKRRARSLAEAGAQYARDRGLDAEARIEEAMASPWRTIVDVDVTSPTASTTSSSWAHAGPPGCGRCCPGSTSHHVVQHAVCPVLIVPTAQRGEARRKLAQANGDAGR